jgi:predicted SAM-dependent methyltransferase
MPSLAFGERGLYNYMLKLSKLSVEGNAKINLGSGTCNDYFQDWINVDINPNRCKKYKHFLQHNITKPLPFESNSIDVVFSEHVWEHLDMREGTFAAKNVYAVLKPNGIFRVCVPDAILRRHSPPERFPGSHKHKTAYTYISLRWVLETAKFNVKLVQYWDVEGNLHIDKKRKLMDYGLIRRPKSLIMDAIK